MNKGTVINKEFNKGKPFDLYFNTTEEAVALIYQEIYQEHHYGEGLERLKKDSVIVDIGAHVGLSTLYFNAPSRKIYSIEPFPETYQCLQMNTQQFPNIKTFNFAITSSKDDRIIIPGKTQGSGGESLFGKGDGLKIKCNTLRDFMSENNIEHIDLLKIDTEGAEYEIFATKGFKDVADNIDFIIGESHIGPLEMCILPEILKDSGFNFKQLPFLNSSYHWNWENEDEKINYEVKIPTLFVAERIDRK